MVNQQLLPEKVCDLGYLIDLSNGNNSFVQEMISIFLSEVTSEVERLENSIKEANFDHIMQASHRLRSSIPFVGIDKLLHQEIHSIEQMAVENKGLDSISELFVKVKKVCFKAMSELKESV